MGGSCVDRGEQLGGLVAAVVGEDVLSDRLRVRGVGRWPLRAHR